MPYYFPRLHRELYSGLAGENLTFLADFLTWPPVESSDETTAELIRKETEDFVARLPLSPREAQSRVQATMSMAEDYSATRIFEQLSYFNRMDEMERQRASAESASLREFLHAGGAEEEGPLAAAPAPDPRATGQHQLLLLLALHHERAVLDEQAGRKALIEARNNFTKALSGLDDDEETLDSSLEAVADGAFAALADGMHNAPLLAPEVPFSMMARAMAPFVPDEGVLYTDDAEVITALMEHLISDEARENALVREVAATPYAERYPALAAAINGPLRALRVYWSAFAENAGHSGQARWEHRMVIVLFHQ